MNALAQAQIANNGATAANWAAFAPHRARVTALLQARGAGSRLCVLGAGNCNDLDLASLSASHAQVHLVDLDAAALTSALERQNPPRREALHLHAPLDVGGHVETLARWRPSRDIAAADVASLANRAAEVAARLPGPFTLTASLCLLSQLIDGLGVSLGASHPRFAEAVKAVRLGHLRLMAALAAPGGEAMLIADVVSSITCPELAHAPEADLSDLLARALRTRNFFHGMNPAALAVDLASDPVLTAAFAPPRWIKPWIWDLGPRLYLVHAVSLTRRA